MTSFKTWLSEIALSSDGNSDNQQVQTMQATSKVGDFGLSNQNFDDERVGVQQMRSNPVQARNNLIKMSSDVIDRAPGGIAQATNGPKVAQYMATQMGMPELFRNFKIMMKKKMQKRMKKQ